MNTIYTSCVTSYLFNKIENDNICFLNGIDAKIKIKRVVNIILAISLIELLLYKSCDGNESIKKN